MADSIEAKVLQEVHTAGCIGDSGEFAKKIGVEDHNVLVGVIKSLEAYEMITTEGRHRPRLPAARLAAGGGGADPWRLL